MDKQKVEWLEREYKGQKETFAIRRSFDGWRVVYPMKNQDGSMNWRNTLIGGNWKSLWKWAGIILLFLLFAGVYYRDTHICMDTMRHFGDNCKLYMEIQDKIRNNLSLTSWELPTDFNVTIFQNETENPAT
jgi:hypothetical protein